MLHDLPIIAGLRGFWDAITVAIADTFQLHSAAAEGLDTAFEGGEALDRSAAGWSDMLPGGPDMSAPGSVA